MVPFYLMSVVHLLYRSDSSSQNTDSGFDDDWAMKSMALMRAAHTNLFATALVASKYFMTYHDKKDARTAQQSDFSLTLERLDDGRSYKMFRMEAQLFY
jgi:hypothetical protein